MTLLRGPCPQVRLVNRFMEQAPQARPVSKVHVAGSPGSAGAGLVEGWGFDAWVQGAALLGGSESPESPGFI